MKITTIEVAGFESALKGMRNPMDSWDLSDSKFGDWGFCIGEKDMELAQNLILAGTEHSKFMRQIQVWADVDMPRYWWSEADTYGFGSKNSCSTMHKLLNNKSPITIDMFEYCGEDFDIMEVVINKLELLRRQFLDAKSQSEKDRYLLRAKRLLPEGFLQLRTWNTNYAELRNMYFQRRFHRLKHEWQGVFCKWIESLPYAKELIMCEKEFI